MADRPTGTVTLVFTDIVDSTRLLEQLGNVDYARMLGAHHRMLRGAIAACEGVEIKTEGDSFFAVFASASDAITAAVQAQRELAAYAWPASSAVGVRMGIHTGDVALVEDEYVGIDVHRAARIAAAAHGGQVLLSSATGSLVEGALPAGVSTRDLGEHRLKGLERAERIFQLVIDGLTGDFPPPQAEGARFDVLPVETTEFIGRQRDLAQVRELLARSRLLTLTGPGGTGKTRLALQLAREVSGEFADGVAFIQLAAISNPELVTPTIRQALSIAEEIGRSALDTLAERLGHRQTLLVLDNFEQLLPATPSVAALLEATERLKIVVTSRAVLHVAGEQEFPVPPLQLPDAAEINDLATLSRSEAVALFLQRASKVRPDFRLTADNAATIAEICIRLDGLPLAVELAASRIKILPPAALLARLEKRLDLLQASGADRSDRQRTLRGAIDWSYGLLSGEQQALFRRLAVFVGGGRLEDAEPVVSAAGSIDLDTLEGLGGLIDHSLLRPADVGDEARVVMLQTIREFGLEKLTENGELSSTSSAHARRFAELASQAQPHLTTGREWTDRLESEHANIRAALAWLAEEDVESALLMAGALWRFWHLRGHLREGSALVGDLLRRPSAAQPSVARARALIGFAGLVYWQLDYAAAGMAYQEALDIARVIGDDALETEVLYSLAYVQAIERDWDGAIESFSKARQKYEAMDAPLGAAWALMGIGMVTHLRGDHAESLPLLTQAEAKFRELNDSFGVRNTISNIGRVLMFLGRLADARRVNRDYVAMSHADEDPTMLSTALIDAAALDALDGDTEVSARLVGAAQRIIADSGGQPPPELISRIEPLSILETKLSAAELAAHVAEGRQLSADEAVKLVIERAVD